VVLVIVLMILVSDARVKVARTLLRGVCMTEELKTIPNLSGMRFEVTYTNCDTLAKEEEVTVYVSRAPVKGESLAARWSNRKTPIFRYVPGRLGAPSIEASGDDRILISIPDISSVYRQVRTWQNVHIDYSIGHIYYP
jgi:hypothetical protein